MLREQPLKPAFSSDLDALIEVSSIQVWIHGHIRAVSLPLLKSGWL
jgi:hypothetical protein